MYRLEEYKNRIDVTVYVENYVDVPEFLKYCRECDTYGKKWSCPPHGFDPEEYWKKHKYFYIIGTKIVFDQSMTEEKKDKKGANESIRQIFRKEKDVLLERLLALEKKYPGSIGLSAGECRVCGKCTRPSGKFCKCPDKMRYSIESLGGNVVKTADELLGIKLKWVEGKLPEYMTLVTGLLTDDPEVEV